MKNTILKLPLLRKAIIVSATAVCLSNQASAFDIVSNNLPFDQERFKIKAEELFGNTVKGYAIAVVRSGALVGTAAGGFAVDGVDAPFPVPMDVSLPANVGSTAKMASTVALLSFFEKDPSASVEQWLNRKIIDYFPRLWRERLVMSNDPWKNAVSQVTFRHLLQHKTGLGVADNSQRISYDFRNGVNPTAIGAVRNYENWNFKILSYILPYIVDPDFGSSVDAKVDDEAGTIAEENQIFQKELATYFGNYMQSQFFDKVSIRADSDVELPAGLWKNRLVPSCDHKTSYAGAPYFKNKAWGTTGDVPLSGDIDGDGKADLVVWRPSLGQWFVKSSEGKVLLRDFAWGRSGDVPFVSDIDGDGKADFVIWRPNTSEWFVKAANGTVITRNLVWGQTGDIPLTGDVNADGKSDFVIWRPSTGKWYARDINGSVILQGASWGTNSDVPLVGDVNGNGTADLVMWRPSAGTWYAREAANATIIANGIEWGQPGDTPLLGDVNGDGNVEFVIYRPTTSEWFARKSIGANDILFRNVKWGEGDVNGTGAIIPLISDITGDFKGNLLSFRQNNGYWSAAGRRYVLGYDSKDAGGPGTPPENITEPPGCFAQGGYWFSAAEYAGWVAEFGDGDTFVSQSVRDLMFDASTTLSRDNRLGWSSVLEVSSDPVLSFVTTHFGLSYLPFHGGYDPNARHPSVIIKLPDGFYAFGFINSQERSGVQIARGLVKAWIAGVDGI